MFFDLTGINLCFYDGADWQHDATKKLSFN